MKTISSHLKLHYGDVFASRDLIGDHLFIFLKPKASFTLKTYNCICKRYVFFGRRKINIHVEQVGEYRSSTLTPTVHSIMIHVDSTWHILMNR